MKRPGKRSLSKKIFEDDYESLVILANPHELEWNQPQFVLDNGHVTNEPNAIDAVQYNSWEIDKAERYCKWIKDDWPNAVPVKLKETWRVYL